MDVCVCVWACNETVCVLHYKNMEVMSLVSLGTWYPAGGLCICVCVWVSAHMQHVYAYVQNVGELQGEWRDYKSIASHGPSFKEQAGGQAIWMTCTCNMLFLWMESDRSFPIVFILSIYIPIIHTYWLINSPVLLGSHLFDLKWVLICMCNEINCPCQKEMCCGLFTKNNCMN